MRRRMHPIEEKRDERFASNDEPEGPSLPHADFELWRISSSSFFASFQSIFICSSYSLSYRLIVYEE